MPDLRRIAAGHRRSLTIVAMLLLIGLGFAALERLTQEIHFADVRAAGHALSAGQIALALMFTAGSYWALTFYDVLALQVIGRRLPWRTAALASFTSYTLSHNLGLSLLTGGSARYRIYTAAGLDGPDVARIVAIASGTFYSGVAAVTGIALLCHHGPLTLAGIAIGDGAVHLLGAAVAALVGLTVIACGMIRGPVRLFGFVLPLPNRRQALFQLGVAVLEISFASAALFVLIPGAPPALLPAFVLAYSLGIVAAVVTHVPGGIGVFEAIVLALVPVDRAPLFAALIAYRLVYYLIPLAVGVVMLALHEGARRRRSLKLLARWWRPASRRWR
jgi:phosphatidylglycerol lysyltransferase